MIGLKHLASEMDSQFEGIQIKTPDRGGPDLYPLPGRLFWPGDQGRGWNIKQKGEGVGPKLSQGPYLEACRTEKSLARV